MGSDLNRFKKPEPTTICLQKEVYDVNQAIMALKELVKEGCTDIELYKIIIEQDLKYL